MPLIIMPFIMIIMPLIIMPYAAGSVLTMLKVIRNIPNVKGK